MTDPYIVRMELEYGGVGLVCPVTRRKLKRPLTEDELARVKVDARYRMGLLPSLWADTTARGE